MTTRGYDHNTGYSTLQIGHLGRISSLFNITITTAKCSKQLQFRNYIILNSPDLDRISGQNRWQGFCAKLWHCGYRCSVMYSPKIPTNKWKLHTLLYIHYAIIIDNKMTELFSCSQNVIVLEIAHLYQSLLPFTPTNCAMRNIH